MRAPPRRTTQLAAVFAPALAAAFTAALAACSPAVERGAEVPTDTLSAAAPSTAVTSRRTTSPVAGDESTADSVRGIVERIGSDPTTQLVVRATNGAVCALQLTGAPPIEALELTLWGRRDLATATMIPGVSCTFTAARYAVRAVDGIAAVDGILRIDGTAYSIESADGARRPLRDVPSILRTQVGARIYWAGPRDSAPAAYGILVPAP